MILTLNDSKFICFFKDVSYLCCIEILGKEENILNGISSLCNCQAGKVIFRYVLSNLGWRKQIFMSIKIYLTNYQSPLLHKLLSLEFFLGPTIGAKMCLEGTREGECVLFKQGSYPVGAIGPVTFLWRPKSESEPFERQLWIWCHPSCYEELWKELESSFSQSENCEVQDMSVQLKYPMEGMEKGKTLSEITDSSVVNNNTKEENVSVDLKGRGDSVENESEKKKETDGPKGKRKQKKGKKQTSKKKESEEQFVKVVNRKSQIGKVSMSSLKDRLVRHRFIGPESQQVLARTLQVANIMFNSNETSYWWKEYYQDKKLSLGFNQQREFWDGVIQCQSAAELSPHVVIGLTVRDPRVFRAKIRNEFPDPDEGEEF